MQYGGKFGPRVIRSGTDFLSAIAGRVGYQRFARVGSKKSDPKTTLVPNAYSIIIK